MSHPVPPRSPDRNATRMAKIRERRDRDYEERADFFARAYADEIANSPAGTNCIAAALRRTDEWARFRFSWRQKADPRITRVVAAVAERHDITATELLHGGREFTAARAEAYAELRDLSPAIPYEVIGKVFNRHHTSVMGQEAKFRRLAAKQAAAKRAVA